MINIDTYLNSVTKGDVIEQLQALPDNSVDLSITSPPYNKKIHSKGWLVKNQGYSHFDDFMPEDAYQQWQIQVLNELFRVIKPGGSLFYNHKIRWFEGTMIHPLFWIAQSSWTIKQEVIWDRGIAANMRGWRYWQVDERVYWLYKPIGNKLVGMELESKHAKLSSIWRMIPARRLDDHPAPFPIELPTRIIFSLANEEKLVVLDPFCGTGTTLVAAKILAQDYIGFDISPDYVAYSTRRLEQSDGEAGKIKKECAKHSIDDTFKARKKRGTTTWPYGPKKNKDGSEEVPN